MKRLLSVILVLCPLMMYGQDDWQRLQNKITSDKVKTTVKTPRKTNTDPLPSSFLTVNPTALQKTLPDLSKGYYAECYHKIVNQYGFWKGVGHKLTEGEMKHMNVYYRLLRRVGLPASAPFEYMQIVNSYGELTANGSYQPHLSLIAVSDSAWDEKLESFCQAEKIIRNGMLVQENYFDADGKLILQYHPVSISKGHIVGHYTDAYGSFAKLSKVDGNDYISIWLDENGYEEKIAIIDEEGYMKPNKNDAFIDLRTHDKDGNVIRGMSTDALGNPMIDNWGNCGWESTFDKDGHELTNVTINERGEPMRMPRKKTRETSYKRVYTYDQWGNMLTKTYLDPEDRPDTIRGGIHRYVYTYNDRGQETSRSAEGLNGQLVNFGTGYAKWIFRYDKDGNRIYRRYINHDGKLCTNGICVFIYHYNNGVRDLDMEFKTVNGVDTFLHYKKVVTTYNDTTWYYGDKDFYVRKRDKYDRQIEYSCYDIQGNPIEPWGYHSYISEYNDLPNYSIHIDKYLDKYGNPSDINGKNYSKSRDYNIYVTEIDSVNHIKTYTKYDGSRTVDKWGHLYDDNFTQSKALLYYDSLGFRGRTLKADALYYKANVSRSERGNSIVWSGENEFGEPSYLLNGDWDAASIYCTNVVGADNYYNEDGDTIPSNLSARRKYKDNLYKAFCIELVDSAAYRAGLRTGDLIVRYGDWQYPKTTTGGRYRETLLIYETVKKATTTKPVVIMRFNPQTKTYRLKELTLPEGTPRQIGFLYHMLYLTPRERARYDRTVKLQRSTVHLDADNTDWNENESIAFIVPYKVGSTGNKRVFMNGFQDNAIILAWEPYKNGRSSLFRCNDDYRPLDNAFDNEYDSIAVHYTVDAEHVLRYVFDNDDFRYYVRRSTTKVPDASAIYVLADAVEAEFHSRQPVISHQKGKKALFASVTDIFDNTHELLTLEVSEDGQFRDRGLSGRFVVLSINDWYEGDPKNLYTEAFKGDGDGKRHLCMAPLLGEKDNYTLGPIQNYVFTTEWLGVNHGFDVVPDTIYYQVMYLAQKQKTKAQKRKEKASR